MSDVWDLFKGRCVLGIEHAANIVHEIEPKSRRPKTWKDPENQVALCYEHHHQVHTEGTANWADRLREARAQALRQLGKSDII